jgi:cellulose synthase/poly-beta-1,6-N-acetylglucosamine synthase-like glycosyltransferase
VLVQILFYFTLAAAATTVVAMLGRLVSAPMWAGMPLGVALLAAVGWVVAWLTADPGALLVLTAAAVLLCLIAKILLRELGWLAVQLLVAVAAATLAYLAYALVVTLAGGWGPLGWIASVLLLMLELAALALSTSYVFEIVDVLGRRRRPVHPSDPAHTPWVAIQVPTYNEPVEVVEMTLRSLAAVDYPNLLVQVVDNNTPDPAVWRPLEELCKQLGERFSFVHLENWPGFKAGALNEATRRLPPELEIVGIVDADYLVEPGFLRAVVGHFADPRVAFVQTPQDYRDWSDDRYLRGLYYSYRYFFSVTMPSRAHRNAIIFAGTMGLIRRSTLDEIGGWNADCITEDAEASLRMLGHGYAGVYEPQPWGRGIMPLSFDGLKKQRHRWAFGGVQILRFHWRELLGLGGGRLRLSLGQRIHYLLGSVQWFGDLLLVFFTTLLVLTALAAATHRQLPVRVLAGPILVVPVLFLLTGLLRATWAMRQTTGCSGRDSVAALRVWFALSWVVSLACLRGLVTSQIAFLRTPKRREGGASWLAAVRSALFESTLAAVSLAAVVAMLVMAPALATLMLGLLLLFLAGVYASAPLASLAAEGIELTPLRRQYLRSAQSTGERPESGRMAALPIGLAAGALAVLALAVYAAPPAQPPPPSSAAELPPIGQGPIQHLVQPSETPPSATPSAPPSRAPSPSGSPPPSASPPAPPSASPSPTR